MTPLDLSNFEKQWEPLNEDTFWAIVAKSLENNTGIDQQLAILEREIAQLSPADIIGFRLRTDKLLQDTYTSEMWCAGYLMNFGCSDDGFEYFRNWIISRGQEIYYKAKDNPDSLVEQLIPGQPEYELEEFWYLPLTVFEKRTGKQLYDYVDQAKFTIEEGSYPEIEFNWREEDPETMKAICPRLFAQLWK